MIKDELSLEITNRCRLACIKCPRTYLGKNMQIRDMDINDFKKIVESKNYKRIFFGGTYGDCIYHPKFYEFIKLAKQNGTVIQIHTNGSGKSIDWWEKIFHLLEPGKDILNIAMDGYKHTVGEYRVNFKEKDFDKNIEIMSLAKNKYNITCVWTFIPFNFNEHQIFDAAMLAIKHNITFCIKKSDRWWNVEDKMIPTNKKLIAKEAKVRLNISD